VAQGAVIFRWVGEVCSRESKTTGDGMKAGSVLVLNRFRPCTAITSVDAAVPTDPSAFPIIYFKYMVTPYLIATVTVAVD
jgi:hypothetical protein